MDFDSPLSSALKLLQTPQGKIKLKESIVEEKKSPVFGRFSKF